MLAFKALRICNKAVTFFSVEDLSKILYPGDYMFYLGIDIGKNNHVASLLDEKGKVIFKAFSFSNSTDGANCLIEKVSAYSSTLEIGMEATGHYWLVLYSWLFEKGFDIKVISPIVTDALRNMCIRKIKNERIDAEIVAKVIVFGEYQETAIADGDTLALHQLCRFRL